MLTELQTTNDRFNLCRRIEVVSWCDFCDINIVWRHLHEGEPYWLARSNQLTLILNKWIWIWIAESYLLFHDLFQNGKGNCFSFLKGHFL